jgi:hypothetical protein
MMATELPEVVVVSDSDAEDDQPTVPSKSSSSTDGAAGRSAQDMPVHDADVVADSPAPAAAPLNAKSESADSERVPSAAPSDIDEVRAMRFSTVEEFRNFFSDWASARGFATKVGAG